MKEEKKNIKRKKEEDAEEKEALSMEITIFE